MPSYAHDSTKSTTKKSIRFTQEVEYFEQPMVNSSTEKSDTYLSSLQRVIKELGQDETRLQLPH